MEERQEKGRKKTKESEGKLLKAGGKWRNMEENGGTPKLNGEQRPLGSGTR